MWREWALYVLSPFTLALMVWIVAAICLASRRRRLALALATFSFVALWIASMPIVALAALRDLEARYPAVAVDASPSADAIVLLGGAVTGPHPPRRTNIGMSWAAGRVWHAADLYRAGKARWIVIAAGNRSEAAHLQAEAEVISLILQRLGVPSERIRIEATSRTTRENALNSLPMVKALEARRILLVTSAQHMPRAMRTFEKAWEGSGIELIPSVTDVRVTGDAEADLKLWLPSLDALHTLHSVLKEFAGIAALRIIGMTA